MDPFDVLGVLPAYELDLEALERRHRELSRALHPDRHSSKPPGERRRVLGRAIEVNEAWRKLRDPLGRAQALLAHYGFAREEGEEPRADPEFLMSIMERREALSAARGERDLGRLKSLASEVEREQAELDRELGVEFAELDRHRERTPGELVEGLMKKLGRRRYYQRFFDELAAVRDELE
ncbi:MAG TPA: Fe-S protein assembly co-chaperone HscB [Polyangiaceae bacterium]